MLSSNSTTFFVSLPSNVKDYAENRPNNFRVHLPKSLQFDGNWGCALQSIHFPYSWPQGVGIESGQWIEVHLAENSSPIRIPIPENLFDSTEECVAYLNDLITANISQIKKSRKRRSTELGDGEERSLFHTTLDRLRNRDPSPPRVVEDEVPFESDTVRAPDPPPPLEEQEATRQREELARTEAEAATKKKAEEAKKKEEAAAKAAAEAQARALAERKKKEEEEKKKEEAAAKAAAEAQARALAERKKKEEEEKKKREAAAKAAAEAKKKEEAAAKAAAEAQAKTLAEAKKKEEEAKQKEEAAAKAVEAQARALAETKKREEEAKQKEEATVKVAAEAQARALSEAGKEFKVVKPADPPKEEEEEEERSLFHTTLDRLRNRDPSPPRVADEVPFESGKAHAPDPPPPLETTALEAYEEPKSKGKGILKELWQTMTMDLSAEELQSSDAQIQARIDQQEYERMGPAPTQLEETASDKVKASEKISKPEDEEERSMAHAFLDRLRGVNNSPADNFIEFKYLGAEDRIALGFSPNIAHVSLSSQLNEVLGIFPNHTHLTMGSKTQKGADFSRGISAFAVCAKDLTEQMILGNRTHSLLRIVSIDGQHMPGMIIERTYDSPMFMRVMPREINEIEIELRTLDGKFVPFIYGTVIITLIFKKLIKY